MKKRALSLILATAMVAGSLVACGGSTGAASSEPAAEWNEEFKTRVKDHYPGYEEVDATHGKIGDIEVVWNITPNENNAYQNNLDEALLKQDEAAANDKVDLFLIEADYALKYVGSDYTMPIADLGITEEDLANQYSYTKDVGSQGRLMAGLPRRHDL